MKKACLLIGGYIEIYWKTTEGPELKDSLMSDWIETNFGNSVAPEMDEILGMVSYLRRSQSPWDWDSHSWDMHNSSKTVFHENDEQK